MRGAVLTLKVSLEGSGAVVAKQSIDLGADGFEQGRGRQVADCGLVIDHNVRHAVLCGMCWVGRVDDVDEEISLLDSDHCRGLVDKPRRSGCRRMSLSMPR